MCIMLIITAISIIYVSFWLFFQVPVTSFGAKFKPANSILLHRVYCKLQPSALINPISLVFNIQLFKQALSS